jgi:cation:H+ antiporter
MLYSYLAVFGGLLLLVYGADRFVEGAAGTARSLGVPPLIIGMTVVGLATSAPELLVGAVAAWDHKTNIAIGNAIGSNIANIGLVLGATVVTKPLLIASRTLRREYLTMCVSIVIALLLLLDLRLDRLDGAILLLSLAIIIWWMAKVARESPKADPLANEFAKEMKRLRPVSRSLLLLILGLALLLSGAELLVWGAINIAHAHGVSDLVIGLTVVAVGTSLPELAASVVSALKDEADIAIGNVIGSNMFNMLMVLGVPALIHPDSFGPEVLTRDFSVMVLLTVMMGWMVFVHGHGKFDRLEGGALLSCYGAYMAWLYFS